MTDPQGKAKTAKNLKQELRKQRIKEGTGDYGAHSKHPEKLNEALFLSLSGTVESAHVRGHEQLACSYEFIMGPDWRLQQSRPVAACDSQYSNNLPSRSGATSVWNFPIEATFTSTNVSGWPRLVMTLFDKNLLARGYGSLLIPPYEGTYTRYVRMFVPKASSPMQDFLGWLINAPPEFREGKFIAQNNDREVTRTESEGVLKVILHVATKNMGKYGYTQKSAIGN